MLAYFERPAISNRPTETLNGRLEHLRGSAHDSATSPTTSPAACSKPADSDPNYTLDCEEPLLRAPGYWRSLSAARGDRSGSRVASIATTVAVAAAIDTARSTWTAVDRSQ